MNTNNALVSRQATPSNAPVAMQAQTDALMVRAKMIASQGDMIPKRYQNNPGACLMLVDWADRNNVSIIDALGHVAFVYGKPVVEARLQKKMARERGYGTELLETTDDHAIVVVVGADGKRIGEPVKYTWQMAEDYGIHLENKKTGQWKSSWRADRAHMLVLRATTRALDYYGDGTFGDVIEDDPEPHDAPPEPETGDPVDPEPGEGGALTELVDSGTWDTEKAEADIRKTARANGVKVADLCRRFDVPMISDLAATYERTMETLAWIDEQT